MKANGFAYFVDALTTCANSCLAPCEEDDSYTKGQIIEHMLPPRPQTNDLKAVQRTVEQRAKREHLTADEQAQLAEELMYEVDNKPRSATKLSRIKTQMTPQEVVREFLMANALDRTHAEQLDLVAHDAVSVMQKIVRRSSVFCSVQGTGFERVDNAVYLIATSPQFPDLVRSKLQPAVLAYLNNSHQGDAADEFANTLDMLMRKERTAFAQAATEKASDFITVRATVLGHLLAASLCGSCGVRALSRDADARATTETVYVDDMAARYAAAASVNAHATLTEQIIDAQGNVSFGASHALGRNTKAYLGRMPGYENEDECESKDEKERSVELDSTSKIEESTNEPKNSSCSIAIPVRYAADGVGSAVSRTHAVVFFNGRCWMLRDLESRNGTALARVTYDAERDEEVFSESFSVSSDEHGTELRNGDVVFLAPARYTGGHLGPNPEGATYRFTLG